MDVVYEPKGKAREYAALACNLYETCPHGCTYCYVPDMPVCKFRGVSRKEFHQPARARKDILKRLRADLKSQYMREHRDTPVQFCFTCDPYPTAYASPADAITGAALKLCGDVGQAFTVLTKNPAAAAVDWPLIAECGSLGVTITSMDETHLAAREPNAAPYLDRRVSLEVASSRGLKTWISAEPTTPCEAARIVQYFGGIVDQIKVGKMNHQGATSETEARLWAELIDGLHGQDFLVRETLVTIKADTLAAAAPYRLTGGEG